MPVAVKDRSQSKPTIMCVTIEILKSPCLTVFYQKQEFTNHPTYPFPIPCFSECISTTLKCLPSTIGKSINDQPDLDLLYFEPYIPKYLEREIFKFLRVELPFYRVEYKIKRGGIETQIRTPRSAQCLSTLSVTDNWTDTPLCSALMKHQVSMKLAKWSIRSQERK
jgi:hypothetical protein